MSRNLEERRPAITPQLAIRVAVLGGVALVAFSIIFFRLWFLQVLTGEDYVSQAADNRVRKIRVEAPRGDIVDRNDKPLVRTREAPVVQIVPSALPESERAAAARYAKLRSEAELRRLDAERDLRELDDRRRAAARREGSRRLTRADRRDRAATERAMLRERRKLVRASRQADPVAIPPLPADRELRSVYRRLSRVLDVSTARIHERVVEGIAEAPYADVTIKTGVSRAAYNYLYERREQFPGVRPTSLYLRHYPEKQLGAHIFGTLREISPEERKLKRYSNVDAGTRIGKDGIEETYDDYLRGTPGFDRVVIDAFGERDERRRVSRREPRQGHRVRLTLDLDLQEAAHKALQRAMAASKAGAQAGAYVAMNPENGEVYALGSYPSFDANVFAKPLSQSRYDALRSEANGSPLFNRAIGAAYPTGSTFKPITALAALETGILTPGQIINDPGYYDIGDRKLKNARDAVFGALELTRALKVSSDVFFYTLGARANARGPVIQRWARELGFGRKSGIDLPGEVTGLVPDRKWRDSGYRRYERCVKREDVPAQTTAALLACGGIERPWTLGDNVNLAIGQGDFQATPLQMAVGYSAIVNDGGKIVRPHLGLAVEDGEGRIVEELRHPARRRVQFDPSYKQAIMTGLRRAAMEPGGTSYGVFEGFAKGRLDVYGKTGTVERPGQADQAWYAAYVPHPTRPIVVVVTVEKGGFGSDTAAPAARLILSEWFDLGEDQFRGGVSTE
jgi:penicillin-binding protein 2